MKFSSLALLVLGSSCSREAPRTTGDAMPPLAPSSSSTSAALDGGSSGREPERTGAVTIRQTRRRSASSLAAYFIETSASGIDCTLGASADGCTLRVCTRSMTQSATTRKAAGDILVSVSQFPSTLSPTRDGTTDWYAPRPLAPVKDGEAVLFDAAGGDGIPPFKGTVTAPAWITLSKPVVPTAPKTLFIKQSLDLELAWSAATKGVVDVTLVRAEREKQTSVECAFDAASSGAKMSSALLRSLPSGHAVFAVDVVAKTVVNAGAFAVTLAVSDALFSGSAELVAD